MMKFLASAILIVSLFAGTSSQSAVGLVKPDPSRIGGGEGIPWPLGEKTNNDSWYFELAGEQYRIDIRKDRYIAGQWTYDVRLSNVTRKFIVGKGMGVYNEKFYSFAVRDVEGRFYQFATLGQGDSFTLVLTVYSEYTQEIFNLKTTRSLSY